MQMKPRFIAPFSAALLAGALAASPVFAQASGPDPSTKAAARTEAPAGQPSGTYAGIKIDHGPGVIPNDAPKGQAGLGRGTASSPQTAGSTRTPVRGSTMARRGDDGRYAYRNDYYRDDDNGGGFGFGLGVDSGFGPYAAADRDEGYAYGYGPYGYDGDYAGRCYQRRVFFNNHWEWQRLCR
jgi:hypothetical protein